MIGPLPFNYRPSGAFKLLVTILYSKYALIEKLPRGGYIKVNQIRRLARHLGTDSKSINKWISYLHMQGYLSDVSYSTCRRAVQFRVRPVSNYANKE